MKVILVGDSMKRILISCLLAISIFFAATISAGAADGYYLGDADGDEDVSAIDVTLILRKMVFIPVTYFNEQAADVDGEGLDVIDATLIQRYLADIKVPYPIGIYITVYSPPTKDPYELPVV